jgi:hypothetical protein
MDLARRLTLKTAFAAILALAVAAFVAALAIGCSTKSAGPSGPTYMTREELLDPNTCAMCHPNHFADWSGSMHAYASEDPVFRAMNARGQRETDGGLGDFCVQCHAPMAVHEQATTDGLNLDQVPQPLHGVTCFFCHTVDAVTGTHNNPLQLESDITMLGEYTDPVANTAHPAAYSALHDRNNLASAPLCGACHDIVSPLGADIERTYQDWQASLFSDADGGDTCAQCHMQELPNGDGLVPIANAPNVFARKYHVHSFPAVDTALIAGFPTVPPANLLDEPDAGEFDLQTFLNTTFQTALCVVSEDGNGAIRVIVDNVAAGHSVPSGSAQDRRLWAEVIAYKAGKVVYQSGVVPDGTPVTEVKDDPDLWLIRDCMFDQQGNQVDMFWQAASYETNLIPYPTTSDPTNIAFYRTHVVQFFPRTPTATLPAAPDKVTLRLLFQPIGLDVLQDLVSSGDLDASVPAGEKTLVFPEPILTWTPAAATQMYVDPATNKPTLCVGDTALNVTADKVAAVNHVKCKP